MRVLVIAAVLVYAAPAVAQIQFRPTEPPLVTAVNEAWYQLREPIQFAGELYYPAGATVFFNGNIMVRAGHYNGVPLYADATLEPYSIILVPISRGLLQPYERPRRGELAGTTGSRPPAFPGRLVPETRAVPMAAAPPTSTPLPAGAMGVFTPSVAQNPSASAALVRSSPDEDDSPRSVGTSGIVVTPPAPPLAALASLRRPESNDGIWVPFGGEKWVSAGPAIPLAPEGFRVVGEYAGFPVFARRELQEDVIYLPTVPGLIAPYRLK